MTNITANYDEPWKEAIGDYFDSFLSFFFPEVYQLIDWRKSPLSLDKELQKITASSETGKKLADKLFQVWLHDNQEVWVLVHVEIQSQYEGDFAQRMYIYNYRAFDLYRKPVISLAILGDETSSWRPNSYGYSLGGCQVGIQFPTVKLLDYETQWQELEINPNPFAIIVMAHLKTKSTTGNLRKREQEKWNLVRSLYEKHYQKNEIVKLFKLIDLMMTLPEELQESLEQKITNYEEERKMPLLSNMELRAIERGKKQGKQEGIKQTLKDNIMQILQKRFTNVSSEVSEAINSIDDIPELQRLHLETISVNSVAEFQDLIKQN